MRRFAQWRNAGASRRTRSLVRIAQILVGHRREPEPAGRFPALGGRRKCLRRHDLDEALHSTAGGEADLGGSLPRLPLDALQRSPSRAVATREKQRTTR